MKMNELFEAYDCDTQHRVQAIFSSIFVYKIVCKQQARSYKPKYP